MKNKLFSILALLIIKLCSGQVGLNTQNPQGIFHVDSGKNNNDSGVPTVDQQADDFTIVKSGDVGIGTTDPSARLHIVSTSGSALRIADGSQGENKILASDSEGYGSWISSTAARKTISGTIPASSATLSSDSFVYLNANIILPPGNWLVMMGTTLVKASEAPSVSWIHFALSNSATSFSSTADIDLARSGRQMASASAPSGSKYSFAKGVLCVRNSGTVDKTYYVWARRSDGDVIINGILSSSVEERYFYAIPTN